MRTYSKRRPVIKQHVDEGIAELCEKLMRKHKVPYAKSNDGIYRVHTSSAKWKRIKENAYAAKKAV